MLLYKFPEKNGSRRAWWVVYLGIQTSQQKVNILKSQQVTSQTKRTARRHITFLSRLTTAFLHRDIRSNISPTSGFADACSIHIQALPTTVINHNFTIKITQHTTSLTKHILLKITQNLIQYPHSHPSFQDNFSGLANNAIEVSNEIFWNCWIGILHIEFPSKH